MKIRVLDPWGINIAHMQSSSIGKIIKHLFPNKCILNQSVSSLFVNVGAMSIHDLSKLERARWRVRQPDFLLTAFVLPQHTYLAFDVCKTPCTGQHNPILLFVTCSHQFLVERFMHVRTDRKYLKLSFSVNLTAALWNGLVLSSHFSTIISRTSNDNPFPCLVKGLDSISSQVN